MHGFYIWPRVIGSVCTRWKVIPILGIRLEKKWTTLHRQLSWILRTPSCIIKQADSWRERKKKKHNNQKNNTTPPPKRCEWVEEVCADVRIEFKTTSPSLWVKVCRWYHRFRLNTRTVRSDAIAVLCTWICNEWSHQLHPERDKGTAGFSVLPNDGHE